MVASLQAFLARAKALKSDVGKEAGPFISKQVLRKAAEDLATDWFQSLTPGLAAPSGPPAEVIEKYSTSFARLLKLSNSTNRKTSYAEVLATVLKAFHDDLILPVQMRSKLAKEVSLLSKLFENLPESEDFLYQRSSGMRIPGSVSRGGCTRLVCCY